MTVRRIAIRLALMLAGAALAAGAYAHPGHGAPVGHTHGLFEALVLVGVVAVGVWIARGKR
ncbi:MAG: hypothetical protein LJE97_00740 [Betaproteobacteria bacterium]|nr:hypothetical protein [Betaproteobacteria bacterium]